MCTGADVCYVHRELLNGVFYTTWYCLKEELNYVDLVCNGAFNTDTEGYACCNDMDNCNQNLEIVLPIEVPTEQIVPSTTTVLPRPSSTFMAAIAVNTSSSIIEPVPLLSSSAVQSTNPVAVLPPATFLSTVNAAMKPTSLVPESTSVPTIKGT